MESIQDGQNGMVRENDWRCRRVLSDATAAGVIQLPLLSSGQRYPLFDVKVQGNNIETNRKGRNPDRTLPTASSATDITQE